MSPKKLQKKKPRALSMAELNEYYLVQFELPATHQCGGVRFGIVNSSRFGEDVPREAKRGNLVISDCELPISRVRASDQVTRVPIGLGFDNLDPVYDWLAGKHKAAIHRALDSKTLVHQLFSLGVADGSARYVVVKENKRSLKVEWRGYGGLDRYTDAILGWGGTFPRDSLEHFIESKQSLRWLLGYLDSEVEQRAQRKREATRT